MKFKSKTVLMCLILAMSVFTYSMAGAEKPITLMIENVYPATHSRLGEKGVIGQWMDAVERQSNGRIKFERHWGGEPIPKKETLNAVSRGLIDIVVAAPTYYSGQIAIADIAFMPRNFKSYSDLLDLWWNSPVGKHIDDAYQKRANAKFLFPAIFAPENFQISKKTKKIVNFQDFKNLKIRAAGGMATQTVKYLGASPVVTIGGDYYTAMQRGTIDAGLMATYSLESYKMWEVCDQVVNPPILNRCFVGVWMNLDKFKSMEPELQNIMLDAWRKLETHLIAYLNLDDARINNLALAKGVDIYTLPLSEQKKMWKAVDPVWDDYVEICGKQGMGPEAKEIREIITNRFEGIK